MSKPTTVRELLSSPGKWCKDEMAKNVDGDDVDEFHPEACQWCLLGAIGVVYGPTWTPQYDEAKRKVLKVLRSRRLASRDCLAPTSTFNDAPTTDFPLLRSVIEEAGI